LLVFGFESEVLVLAVSCLLFIAFDKFHILVRLFSRAGTLIFSQELQKNLDDGVGGFIIIFVPQAF
jgi:hypothetical protein